MKDHIHKHVQKRLADSVVEVVSNTQAASYSKYFHIHLKICARISNKYFFLFITSSTHHNQFGHRIQK